MKKFILLLAFITIKSSVFSCDYCNCYLGLNPQYKKNFIGLRYSMMSSTGTHISANDLAAMGLSKNNFREINSGYEIDGQIFPARKLQLLYTVPYIYNSEIVEGVTEDVPAPSGHNHGSHSHIENGTTINKGIGDPLLIAHYQVFNKISTDSSGYAYRLLAGGGIKIPLGNWELEESEPAEERSHLPGTGSWDYITSIRYLSQYKKFGLNVNLNYLITTTNDQDFRFSNRLNTNATLLYKVNFKNIILYPSAGAYYESSGRDKDGTINVMNSGGKVFYGHAGIDIYYGNISINTAFHFPVKQVLYGDQPEIDYRFITGIVYAFN